MGLRLSFDVDDLGLQRYIEDDEYGIIVQVDYSEAFEAFVDTFIDKACDLVPVDTGFLMSSIDGDAGADECTVWAKASYAQYVEYGTYKMAAQPYFEPAVKEAYATFMMIVNGIMSEAEEDLQSQVEAAQEEEEGGGGGGGRQGTGSRTVNQMASMVQSSAMTAAQASGMGIGGQIVAGAIALAIFFPIALVMYGIADAISGGAVSGNVSASDNRVSSKASVSGDYLMTAGGANLLSLIEID